MLIAFVINVWSYLLCGGKGYYRAQKLVGLLTVLMLAGGLYLRCSHQRLTFRSHETYAVMPELVTWCLAPLSSFALCGVTALPPGKKPTDHQR
jgi:hypothetical protein